MFFTLHLFLKTFLTFLGSETKCHIYCGPFWKIWHWIWVFIFFWYFRKHIFKIYFHQQGIFLDLVFYVTIVLKPFWHFWDLTKYPTHWYFLSNMVMVLFLIFLKEMFLKINYQQQDIISDLVFNFTHLFEALFDISLIWKNYPTYCGPFWEIWHWI